MRRCCFFARARAGFVIVSIMSPMSDGITNKTMKPKIGKFVTVRRVERTSLERLVISYALKGLSERVFETCCALPSR